MNEMTMILSRVQFGMTSIFHFLIVPMTIGLLTFLVITETIYAFTGKQDYLNMTKYFGRVYIFFYAVGIVTGIIQEFQFGMNWSEYSKFVGDVFGVPLAIEALLAFFIESTFLGLWMFTWDKVGPKLHALFLWVIYLGSLASAVFILMANAFMQTPVGFEIVKGRARLTNFTELITSPQFKAELIHVLLGCLIVGGFVVAGVSAWQSYKHKDKRHFFRKTANIGLLLALFASNSTVSYGDAQGKLVLRDQPMKFSAIEALWEDTTDPAPYNVVADINVKEQRNDYVDEEPVFGSILAYGKPEGMIPGMKSLQKEYEKKYGEGSYIPPVKTLFWGFRFMVIFGFLFIQLAVIGLIFNNLPRKSFGHYRGIRYLFMGVMFLPFLVSTAGWVVTEVGRYPFTIYGLFKISDSVSPNLTTPRALFSIGLLFVVYTIAGGILFYLSRKAFNNGISDIDRNFEVVEAAIDSDPFDKEALQHE